MWSIIGKHEIKFIVVIAGSAELARQYLTNIKSLMMTEPLRTDMGPFQIPEGEWSANAIDIPKYGARIIAVSAEQKIRGVLHGSYRPQIVILDDLENMTSAQSEDLRKRLYSTFNSDILPMGDLDTRYIVIGTRLHQESLIMQFKRDNEEGKRSGIFRSYPIIDEHDCILWPGKFPDMASIEQLKKDIGDESAWAREFLLQVVSDDEVVVQKEWLQYYDQLPGYEKSTGYRFTATGIDLAIGEGMQHDYTAMVSASVYHAGEKLKIYIHAAPLNERLRFPDTVERAKLVSVMHGNGQRSRLIVEAVGYQSALTQELQRQGYPAEEYKPHGSDKRARLVLTTSLIRNGTILFPLTGADQLIKQILGFPHTRFDDLTDAFTALILKIMEGEGIQITHGFLQLIQSDLERLRNTDRPSDIPNGLAEWVKRARVQGGL